MSSKKDIAKLAELPSSANFSVVKKGDQKDSSNQRALGGDSLFNSVSLILLSLALIACFYPFCWIQNKNFLSKCLRIKWKLRRRPWIYLSCMLALEYE
jgi:hypothetical protein